MYCSFQEGVLFLENILPMLSCHAYNLQSGNVFTCVLFVLFVTKKGDLRQMKLEFNPNSLNMCVRGIDV